VQGHGGGQEAADRGHELLQRLCQHSFSIKGDMSIGRSSFFKTSLLAQWIRLEALLRGGHCCHGPDDRRVGILARLASPHRGTDVSVPPTYPQKLDDHISFSPSMVST
jgi:hypothetical protein